MADAGAPQFAPLYPAEMPLCEKIETIATRHLPRRRGRSPIAGVSDQLKQWEEAGFGHLPVCMAKTQYRFSTDPTALGAPTGPRRRRCARCGCRPAPASSSPSAGEIMTMPGLPKVPSAENIYLDDNGADRRAVLTPARRQVTLPRAAPGRPVLGNFNEQPATYGRGRFLTSAGFEHSVNLNGFHSLWLFHARRGYVRNRRR